MESITIMLFIHFFAYSTIGQSMILSDIFCRVSDFLSLCTKP